MIQGVTAFQPCRECTSGHMTAGKWFSSLGLVPVTRDGSILLSGAQIARAFAKEN